MKSAIRFTSLLPGSAPLPVRNGDDHPRRRSGFTLVELLVVITIIAVLAAVALFATRGIRKKAMQANAISSLRQIAACSASYSMENNGDINTMRWGGDPKEGGPGIWLSNTFWGRLQPYIFGDIAANNQKMLGSEINRCLDGLFNSPDADSMAGTFISNARIYHDTSGLPVPIAFNTNLHKWGSFLKTSSFDDPSRILYSTYGSGFFSEADGKSYVPVPTDKSMALKSKIYYFDDRTVAASFLDGHMEMLTPPIPARRFK
jgi:prepilin-type N-terminal cleavage/methylation domain-containing protein